MYQHGKITKAEMEEAKAEVQSGLADDATRQSFAGSKYDAFLDVVINELEKMVTVRQWQKESKSIRRLIQMLNKL